jgi:hypothetical protein
MSGEFINTHSVINKSDIWDNGYSNFSSKSIQELFDVNDDGEFDGVERDRAEASCLFNTLDSIDPVVARAFNDENFRLQTGAYLTTQQRTNKAKILNLIEKYLLVEDVEKIQTYKKQFNLEPQLSPVMEEDNKDLKSDLSNRQYLNQAEINNDV